MMKQVLLPDGWHSCDPRSFAFIVLSLPVRGLAHAMDVTAAVWRERGEQLVCPVASIQAMQFEGDDYGELVKGGGAEILSGFRAEEPIAAA
jgi:hypothetical protein